MNRVVTDFFFKSEYPLHADFVSQLYDKTGFEYFIYRRRVSLQYETFRQCVLNVFRRKYNTDTPLDRYYDLIQKEFEGEIVGKIFVIFVEQSLITKTADFSERNLWMMKISYEQIP